MNRQPFERPPRWWSPKLSRAWVSIWRPFRHREQIRKHRVVDIEVNHAETVRSLLDEGLGVLITPNHCSHADSFALYEAADRVGTPLYSMMAWQVFQRGSWLRSQILRQHGAFSIDREGTDLSALRQARQVLQDEPYPLAIFPEGEVYHLNERLTPFREGPAAIAVMAAKKGHRPVACVPCAMRYTYVQDPTDQLTELMSRLEISLHWRPRNDLSLERRIYHLAEGVLALKEVEILGQTRSGPIPERIQYLIEFLLEKVESRHGLERGAATVPERVKAARNHVINLLATLGNDDPNRKSLEEDLDDLFLVIQAFSYPGDYVAEQPTIERIAETLDKFEEDVLGVKTATIRGARRAEVTFGEPVILPTGVGQQLPPKQITQLLQDRVGQMLQRNVSQPIAAASGF